LDWLSDYLPTHLSIAEIGERLTATGLEVEKSEVFDALPGGLRGIVVGEVREVRQHPNADRLRVTKVDVGAPEWLNIVCGASNVAEGQKVAVAMVGAELYPAGSDKPLVIKKSALRMNWALATTTRESWYFVPTPPSVSQWPSTWASRATTCSKSV
jgi:phenylalanyl-tRNA synthetase beta chain